MPVVRHRDPAAFLAAAQFMIVRDEAEGIMLQSRVRALLAREARDDSRRYLATVSGTRTRGAAFQLADHPLSLGASDAAAGRCFADDLAIDFPSLCGVYGRMEPCERFARRWTTLTGREQRIRFRLRHHVLTDVASVPQPSGAPRIAGRRDARWVLDCLHAFIHETGVPDSRDDLQARCARGIARRLYWIWDDRGPAALAGWNPATPETARIAPVYTVPARRGRGYATALVALLSQALRDVGVARISLTTDLANPVSNAIYARIGYRPISDGYHFDFLDRPGG